jgi:hypothetical protein
MKIAAEVSAFKGKVCGNKYFRASRRPQDRAVVADAQCHGPASRRAEVAANLLNQGQLSHDVLNTAEKLYVDGILCGETELCSVRWFVRL